MEFARRTCSDAYTGKTTVITEIIRQILVKDSQAKILITSQTNLAVDNVLKKISKLPNISFIRLGRNIEEQELNDHSFDNKLNIWARTAKSQSDRSFNTQKKNIGKKQKNLPPGLNLIAQELLKKQDWEKTKVNLDKILSGMFAKGIEHLGKFTDSRTKFEPEFYKHLGEKHKMLLKFESLKRKWNSILSNIENYDAIKSKYISSINVVGATANHIAASKYRDFKFEFDYVIMDEAAKATPSETLVPLNMAHNVVLVGDHKQLPPLVTATEKVKKQVEEKLNTEGELIDFDKTYYDQPSLFEIMYDGSPMEFKEMLNLQFRMPRMVGDIVSKLVYNNRLKSNEYSGKPHNINLRTSTSIFMVDINKFPNRFHKIDPISKSSYNPVSAQTAIDVLKKVDSYTELFSEAVGKPYEVGVITGYGKQAEYLSDQIENTYFKHLKLNENLTVATVDSFQGSEKDIIIYDIVRSSKQKDNLGLGFLEMPNRINVALTRVKRLLIMIGDADFVLNVNPSFRWKKNYPEEPLLLKEFVGILHERGLIYENLNDIFYG